MNMNSTTDASIKLHPLHWIAGISLILLSIVGIASLTGLLGHAAGFPGLIAASAPATPLVLAEASPRAGAVPEIVSTPAVATHKPSSQVTQASVAVASQHKAAKRKVVEVPSSGPAVMLPPPSSSGMPPDYIEPLPVAAAPPIRACQDCGVVEDVRQIVKDGPSTGLGAIAGGVLGGALGSNLGKGHGRTLASVAAAIGGGMIGNQIEKSQHQTISYQVSLRMEDGTTRLIDVRSVPTWRIGDTVRLVNGVIVSPVH